MKPLPASDQAVSLNSFVRELTIAWKKLGIYQQGHPATAGVIERAHRILVSLLAPTGTLSLGIGKDAFFGPDEKLDAPYTQQLARALYQRGVAVLRFREGIEAAELGALLQLLGPYGSREEVPLEDQITALRLEHIRIEGLDLSRLSVTDVSMETPPESPGSLWGRILRQLMNLGAGELADEEGDGGTGAGSAAEVLALIQNYLKRHPELAGDAEGGVAGRRRAAEILSGLVATLAGAVDETLGEAPSAAALRSACRHVAELLRALPEPLREGVIDAALRKLGPRDDGAEGLEVLVGSVAAAELVSSLRRLRAEKIGFSPRALRVVEALLPETGLQDPAAEVGVDRETLVRQLREFFAEEDPDRFHPDQEAYDRFLLELPRLQATPPERTPEVEDRLQSLTEKRQLLQTSRTLLDLLQRPIFDEDGIGAIAERLESVFASLLAAGRFAAAIAVVEELQQLCQARQEPAVRTAADRCLGRLRRGETMAALIETLGDLESRSLLLVRQLVMLLGPEFIRRLVIGLVEETDLPRRRHTFNLLSSLGPAIVPYAVEQLSDRRWYVVRNMLSLLRYTADRSSVPVVEDYLQHSDPRVRLEAIRCLAAIGGKVDPELLARTIADPDPKIAEAAVALVGNQRIPEGAEPLLALLRRWDPLGLRRPLRIKALQSLGELGKPEVLAELAPFLAWRPWISLEERQTAYTSLEGYPEEARRPWVERGLRSRDPAIRGICQRLLAKPPVPGVRRELSRP